MNKGMQPVGAINNMENRNASEEEEYNRNTISMDMENNADNYQRQSMMPEPGRREMRIIMDETERAEAGRTMGEAETRMENMAENIMENVRNRDMDNKMDDEYRETENMTVEETGTAAQEPAVNTVMEDAVINPVYRSYQGMVTAVRYFYNEKEEIVEDHYFMEVTDGESQAVFYLSPETYYADCNLKTGDEVIGFFRTDQPMILIYPPRYNIRALARVQDGRSVKADYFGQDLVSSDGMLKLNISQETYIINENGRPYCGRLEGKDLFVIYGASTRSIPAQAVPSVVVVLG